MSAKASLSSQIINQKISSMLSIHNTDFQDI